MTILVVDGPAKAGCGKGRIVKAKQKIKIVRERYVVILVLHTVSMVCFAKICK